MTPRSPPWAGFMARVRDRRSPALTLFGGFASTACWPLSAYLVDVARAGAAPASPMPRCTSRWPCRSICSAFPGSLARRTAGAHGRRARPSASTERQRPGPRGRCSSCWRRPSPLGSAVSALMSVHLLTILQGRDLAPCGGRRPGRAGRPRAGRRASDRDADRPPSSSDLDHGRGDGAGRGGARPAVGGPAAHRRRARLYGAGIGIESIARGTLPLALFGAYGYATVIGRLAMPSLLAQAASPVLGSLLMRHVGPDGTLTALLGAAILDVALVMALFIWMRSMRHA